MSSLARVRAVAGRETRAFFSQPSAWVFLGAFLLLGAFLGLSNFFARGVSDLRDYFSGLRYALVLLAPAAGMRLWAEERRSGTLELLFALPVRPAEAALGKFLAGLAVIGVGLALSLALPLSLSPFASFDLGQLAGAYAGALLLAAMFLSLSALASALSESQEVAFLAGAGACLALNVAGDPRLVERAAEVFPRGLVTGLGEFAVEAHYGALTRGLLEARSLVYFLGVTSWALFGTTLLLERRGQGARERWFAFGLASAALFLGLGIASERRLSLRLDLSLRGASSLSPLTREALEGLEGELVVRAYISRDRLPEALLPRVREVLDLLDDVEAAGKGRVRLEVVDPTTPDLQDAARRQGVERFQLEVREPEGGVSLRSVYAGIVIFSGGRPPAAIPVALDPRGSLEYQLLLGIRRLLARRPRVGIGGVDGLGPEQVPEVSAALQRFASVEAVDLSAPELVAGLDLLVYLAPRAPSEVEIYALDQHLQRGGRLLLLAEGYEARADDAWERAPLADPIWAGALRAWGVRFGAQLIAISPQPFAIRGPKGARVQTPYPWFIQPSGADNPASALAGGLPRLLLPFACELSPLGPQGEVLLLSPPAWAPDGVQRVEPGRRLELPQAERRARALGVGVRGGLRSFWEGRSAPGDVPAPVSAEARAEGTLLVVADTDFVRSGYLRQAPGNVDLALNAVEWCLEGASLGALRGRAQAPALHGLERRVLGLRPADWAWLVNLALPLAVVGCGLGRIGWRRAQRGARAGAERSVREAQDAQRSAGEGLASAPTPPAGEGAA